MAVISESSAVTNIDGQRGDSARFATRLLGGLVATIPALPLFAIVATVTVYVSTAGTTNNTLVYGAGTAIVGWLVVGGVAASFDSVARANPGVYGELLARVEALDIDVQAATARLDIGSTRMSTMASLPESDSYERAALTELKEHVRALTRDFDVVTTRNGSGDGVVAADEEAAEFKPSAGVSTLRDKGTPARQGSRTAFKEWDLTEDEAREVKHRGMETIVEKGEDES